MGMKLECCIGRLVHSLPVVRTHSDGMWWIELVYKDYLNIVRVRPRSCASDSLEVLHGSFPFSTRPLSLILWRCITFAGYPCDCAEQLNHFGGEWLDVE